MQMVEIQIDHRCSKITIQPHLPTAWVGVPRSSLTKIGRFILSRYLDCWLISRRHRRHAERRRIKLGAAVEPLLVKFPAYDAIIPVGSVRLMGFFLTYAYRFRSSWYPTGSVCRNLPSVGEYIRAL